MGKEFKTVRNCMSDFSSICVNTSSCEVLEFIFTKLRTLKTF